MRCLSVSFLLAAAAWAQDVREALDREDFVEALRRVDRELAAGRDDGRLRYMQAQARVGVARDKQRAEGYAPALDYLERHLTHELVTTAFALTCMWAGEEERGIKALRASKVPLRERIEIEIHLLRSLNRFDLAEARAREVGWAEAERWWGKEAAFRRDLMDRARRAWWVAAAAAFFILLAAGVLAILAPAARPPPVATS